MKNDHLKEQCLVRGVDHWPDGSRDIFAIATIDHERKEVHAIHGYGSPNPHAKTSKKYAKELGYKFLEY